MFFFSFHCSSKRLSRLYHTHYKWFNELITCTNNETVKCKDNYKRIKGEIKKAIPQYKRIQSNITLTESLLSEN